MTAKSTKPKHPRFDAVRRWLKGKKTYIGLGAASVYAVLCIVGVTESNELTWTLIAVWTGFSFRAAMS